jgi:hypothetical protein
MILAGVRERKKSRGEGRREGAGGRAVLGVDGPRG